MNTVGKKLGAAVLSLAFIFAITSQAKADHRYRNRNLSTGKKAAIIGGGAAAGAAIGALMGGKKGALIGGLLGGGAGTGYVVIKDRDNDRDETFYRSRRFTTRDRNYYRDSRYGYDGSNYRNDRNGCDQDRRFSVRDRRSAWRR